MKNGIQQKVFGGAVRGIDVKSRTIRAYASTNEWDRYGERFEPDAFKDGLTNYLKNPVVLWAHSYFEKPIGKTVNHAFDAKGLILDMQFAEHQAAEDVFQLYVGGFMSAFSVGFRPVEIGQEEREGSGQLGIVYKQAELLENSAVPVPANPGALVQKGMFAAAQRVFSPEVAMPQEWDSFEKWQADQVKDKSGVKTFADFVNGGPAPDFKATLHYLQGLGKMLKAKDEKVTDEEVRDLLIQSNNLFRELIYGKAAPQIEQPEGDVSDEEVAALLKEYESMHQAVAANAQATDEDRRELYRVGQTIEKLISGK